LKLIEWRWGLEPLTPDGASMDANNLAYAMNFANPGNSRTVFAQTAHTADRDALFFRTLSAASSALMLHPPPVCPRTRCVRALPAFTRQRVERFAFPRAAERLQGAVIGREHTK